MKRKISEVMEVDEIDQAILKRQIELEDLKDLREKVLKDKKYKYMVIEHGKRFYTQSYEWYSDYDVEKEPQKLEEDLMNKYPILQNEIEERGPKDEGSMVFEFLKRSR